MTFLNRFGRAAFTASRQTQSAGLARRFMGGGGSKIPEPQVNKVHTYAGEFFGCVAWFWIFYRCKEDGAVVFLGVHPWDNH